MRSFALLVLLLLLIDVPAQDIRINELQCGARKDSSGSAAGGWVELYNAGKRKVDLQGFTIALNGAQQRISARLSIDPKKLVLLFCDHRASRNGDHLDLDLPRTGGTALLIAPDRSTVLDVFTWPALPRSVSFGRIKDGERAWGFFPHPSPGIPNSGRAYAERYLRAPLISVTDGSVTLSAEAGTTIHYTTDGTAPNDSSVAYRAPLHSAEGMILRAIASAPNAITSPCAARTVTDRPHAISLIIDPSDLWDERTGILAKNDAANYARKGPEWQRQAFLRPADDSTAADLACGITISGSGSRGLPKKNFKLSFSERFNSTTRLPVPQHGAWKEIMLRADATPNAFLRNLFMERIVQRSGSHVDVQPSVPVPLLLNGTYWGTYRAMPAKNAEWVKSLSGAQAVDLIDGPGGHALHGDPVDYQRMVDAVMHLAPADSLVALIDVGSLIDLACFDLWTGRADHDLNVRCWRPRERTGKWRWILYDMDLWAPTTEGTVARMCSASGPEAPYVRPLLANAATHDRLLARMCALLATVLSPEQALPLADSLLTTNASLLADDQERWGKEMNVPSPSERAADLRDHISARTQPLLAQLAKYTGEQLRTMDLIVEPAGAGTVSVEDLALTTDRATMRAFGGSPLRFTAQAAAGMEFAGWKGIENSGTAITIDPARTRKLRAVFRPIGLSRQGHLQQRRE